jgi:beta-lactamase regulating signal transducer with metallopeptidase domain
MQSFVIALLTCSVAMSALALLYLALTPLLAKRYSARGRYYAWLIILIGLIVPFRPLFSKADGGDFSFQSV